jgi:sugar lactone lactonase YvrE
MSASRVPFAFLAAGLLVACSGGASVSSVPTTGPIVTATPPAATSAPTVVPSLSSTLPPSPPLAQLWSATAAAGTPFVTPDGVAIDPSDNVLVLDSGHHRVVKLDPSGAVVATFGTLGHAPGELNCAGFCMIAVDPAGRILITDQGNSRVQVLDVDGHPVDEWGALGSAEGQFNSVFGIAADRDGNVFVTDSGNHRVQKFAPDGTFLLAFGSAGKGPGQFSDDLADIAVDAGGTIYVSDRSRGVQLFDAAGTFLRALGGCDGDRLGSATGVAIDADENVFVFDLRSARLCRFDRDGRSTASWDAGGTSDGAFSTVGGVAVGPTGTIAVGELFDGRVRLFVQH